MQTTNLVLLGVILPFFSIPIITPFVMRIKHFGLTQNVGQIHVIASTFVVFILASYFFGFRVQSSEANIILIILAAAGYLYLIGLVFQIKPRLLGVSLGIVIGFLFLLVILGSVLVAGIEGKTNRIKLASDMFCEAYQFGFSGINSGGLDVSVYSHLGLGINRRVFHASYSAEIKYPFNTPEDACNYSRAKINN